MSKQTPPDGYTFERLNVDIHSRTEFISDDDEIDDFLKTKANQTQGKFASATHVLCESCSAESPRPIRGYITLLPAVIPISIPLPRKVLDGSIHAMLLGKMGVDKQHKGRGLGEYLVKAAFEMTAETHHIYSCPILIVDPKIKAKDFYPKYGFQPLSNNVSRLYITTDDLMRRLESGNIRNV